MSTKLLKEGLFDFVYNIFDHVDSVLESGRQEYLKKELDKIKQKYPVGVAADVSKYIKVKEDTIDSVAEKAKDKESMKEYIEVLRAMGNSESSIRKIMSTYNKLK